MLVEQRYQMILERLRETGCVRNSELRRDMNVSSETIRRDLENMEAQKLLCRTRGGALLWKDEDNTESHSRKSEGGDSRDESRDVSSMTQYALTLIRDGQSIALDHGPASLDLARALKRQFRFLTVITNSMDIINELKDAREITLISTGGVYHPEGAAFVSDMAGLIFSKLNIDLLFLSPDGISVDRGITYQRMDEILVQEKMMKASDKLIVLADSARLGNNSLAKMCGADKAGLIITDSLAEEKQIMPFLQANIPINKV